MSSASRATPIHSLRARLTVWYLSTLALTLALFSILLFVALRSNLYRHHDGELEQLAAGLAETLSGSAAPIDIAAALDNLSGPNQFAMIRDSQGELLHASVLLKASEPGIGEQLPLVHAASTASRDPQFLSVQLERWGAVRFICVALEGQPQTYLQVGEPLGEVEALLGAFINRCLVLLPLVIVLTGTAGWIVAGRALTPIRKVESALGQIQAPDLTHRMRLGPSDRELAGLVSAVNQLLDRVDGAFLSLRRFSADVSHQLHTPLSVLSAALETVRVSDELGREAAGTRRVMEKEIDDMSAIIEGLRDLALADEPLDGRATPVDLSRIVEDSVEVVRLLGEARELVVQSSVEPGVTILGDAVRLRQIVLNLGDNAVKYTPAGGTVAVRLSTAHGKVELRVRDTGEGIASDEAAHLFDRFYRSDSTRSRVDGTGLGLAIASRMVRAHGGTIDVESRLGVGSTFTVRLRSGVGQAQ